MAYDDLESFRIVMIISAIIGVLVCYSIMSHNNRINDIIDEYTGENTSPNYPDNNVPSADEDSVPLNPFDLSKGSALDDNGQSS